MWLKLSCEGQAEIVAAFCKIASNPEADKDSYKHSSSTLAILHSFLTMSKHCNANLHAWIITKNAGILGTPKLFYYF